MNLAFTERRGVQQTANLGKKMTETHGRKAIMGKDVKKVRENLSFMEVKKGTRKPDHSRAGRE